MTVKDLIDRLEQCDYDKEVTDENGDPIIMVADFSDGVQLKTTDSE